MDRTRSPPTELPDDTFYGLGVMPLLEITGEAGDVVFADGAPSTQSSSNNSSRSGSVGANPGSAPSGSSAETVEQPPGDSLLGRWLGVPPAEQAGFDDDAAMLSTAGAVVFAALLLIGLLWVIITVRNRRRAYVALGQNHKDQPPGTPGLELAEMETNGDVRTVRAQEGSTQGKAVVGGGGAAVTQQLTVYCSSALGTINRSSLSPVVSLASLSPMRPKEATE